MGWGPGVPLALIASIESKDIPDDVKVSIYKDMIPAFWREEWNTEDRCYLKSKCFDRAYYLLSPGFIDDYKDEMIEKVGIEWYQFVIHGA